MESSTPNPSKDPEPTNMVEVEGDEDELEDPELNPLNHPLLKRSPTLTSSHLAMVGAKVSHIESLDYEINENDLFKHDWRSRSRRQVLEYICLKWILVFLIGLLMGIVASLINLAVENIAGMKMALVSELVSEKRYIKGFAYFTGINLGLTFIAAFLCVMFAPTAAGPGVPEIKAYLNGVDTPNMFGASTLFVKIIGSIAAVSAGLDLGKEGPLVHTGTCIAALVGRGGTERHHLKWRWLRYVNNDRDRRDLITCGSSAGVCAAFRAPLGGVLFSLEEVATWWRSALLWRTFFSTAIVVVVLRWFIEVCETGKCGLFGMGGLIIFDVSDVTVRYKAGNLVPVVVIGVVGGVLGSLYNHLLVKLLRVYSLINEKGRVAKLILSLLVSLFTSLCLFLVPFLASCTPCDPSLLSTGACPTTGRSGNFKRFNCPAGHYNDLASLLHATNDDAVRNIFSTSTPTEFTPFSLLAFSAVYSVLGLLTFGIAVPSGLFLPIILMGSGFGRLLGLAAGGYWTTLDQGLLAVLGAASLMAGSMRMTVSVCVIFLELTNNLLLLPVTMLVLLIAKSVGDAINPSIYEMILELKGLPFLEPNPEPWMRNLTVGDLANAKPSVIYLRRIEKVGRVLEVLKRTTHNGFPVVDVHNEPVGPGGRINELHGLVLRSHLVTVLRKGWFMKERRRADEWEVRARFTSSDMAERGRRVEEVELTEEEMGMYVDLLPFTNTTPYTVVESMSVAKAVVLFRQVGLRHLLIVPKYQGAGLSPVVGILTRQDLRAHNILNAFPHLEPVKGEGKLEARET